MVHQFNLIRLLCLQHTIGCDDKNGFIMKKILIANRAEIAVRIIRACQDYGVQSVAIYADTDAKALHVTMADEAWGLSGIQSSDTYLNIEKIITIAKKSGADAVHPGYGFLSERAEFAQAVLDAGLIWIGPKPETIRVLGDKVEARKIAKQVGAPLVAGTTDPVNSAAEVVAFAREHGLPVAIKAAFGGGGRGLKVAWQIDEIEDLYASAVREATVAFGRGECFVEQFLHQPRHVEAQVLADKHGNVVVVGTRDCSLQRRNQKLVEEAPAPFLSHEQQQAIITAATNICRAAHYEGAGTVEFLLSADGKISFLEVNTRLQVEHPVTEETTGIDLVIEQFKIADGEVLSLAETPVPRCHAFEFRINAEDPGRGFLPTPGIITGLSLPAGPGVRVDSGIVAGSTIPGTFDSLMMKLIVTGATREQAITRAKRALSELHIEGVASVLPFDQVVMNHPDFVEAPFKVHTRWIETTLLPNIEIAPRIISPETDPMRRATIEIDGKLHQFGFPTSLFSGLTLSSGAAPVSNESSEVTEQQKDQVLSPMTGVLLSWQVQDGTVVKESEVIAVMEAMKMETPITAHQSGVIHFSVQAGELCSEDDVIATIQSV